MSASQASKEQIQGFIDELSGFADTAENTLTEIQTDLEGKKALFSVFADRMFAIKGTAQQLGLPHIANIAALGEEISIKATQAETRPQIRKCMGALSDALSTVKHLLVHHTEETGEEQDILKHRLEATLKALGGARASVSMDEIEALLRARD